MEYKIIYIPLHSQSEMIDTTSRSGAVVARWAHNPKVVSSSLASATKKRVTKKLLFFLYLIVWSIDSSDYRVLHSRYLMYVYQPLPITTITLYSINYLSILIVIFGFLSPTVHILSIINVGSSYLPVSLLRPKLTQTDWKGLSG